MSNAELEAALLAEAPKQWERVQRNRLRMERGKPKWQREIEQAESRAEALRRMYDPELRRINDNLERKLGSPIGGLRCPKCGDPDKHNRMNGKPWCMKCNLPLELPNSANKRFPSVKVLPKTRKLDVTFQGLDK